MRYLAQDQKELEKRGWDKSLADSLGRNKSVPNLVETKFVSKQS